MRFGAEGQRYRAAKEAGSRPYQQVQRAGEAAAQVAQAGRGGFGGPTRLMRRRLATQLRLQPSGAQPPAHLLGSMPAGPIANLPIQTLGQLSSSLTQVRAVARQQAKVQSQCLREELATVAQFQQNAGAQLQEAVFSSLPSVYHVRISSGCFCHLSMCVQQAVHLAGWAQDQSRKTNAKSLLEKDRAHKNRVIMSSEVTLPTTGQPEKPPTSACYRRGLCTCSGSGKSRWKLIQAFLARLKQALPRHSATKKQLLLQGHVCFVLRGVASETLGEEWQDLCREAVGTEEESLGVASGEVWCHVGLQYLKPFHPTMQVLKYLDTAWPDLHNLEQTMHFQECIELFSSLDLSSTWTLQFYKLVCSPAPLGAFSPSRCQVEALEATEEQVLPKMRRRRRAQSPPAAAHSSQGAAPPTPFQAAAAVGEGPPLPDESQASASHSSEEEEGEDLADEAAESEGSSNDDLEQLLEELVHPKAFPNDRPEASTAPPADDLQEGSPLDLGERASVPAGPLF